MERWLLFGAVFLASALGFGQLPSAEAGKFNKALSVGDAAPDWSDLPGSDGQPHSLRDYKAKLVVLVFTCNGCPVAASYQQRMNELMADYPKTDVALVAVNSNPGKLESLDKMTAIAKEKRLGYSYLKDASQTVAKDYGARTTPSVFLLDQDRRIAYMGAIDDNWEGGDAVERHYLRDAITATLAGKKPEVTESRSTGCNIAFGAKR